MSKRIITIGTMFFMLLLFSIQVLTVNAQAVDMGRGWCQRHGNYIGASCPGCSSGGGTPGNNTWHINISKRKTSKADIAKQQRLDESYEANKNGVNFYTNRDWANALIAFQEAVDKNPENQTMKDNLNNAKQQLWLQQQEQLRIQQQQQQERQNKAAVLKMQQSVQAFTQTLNSTASKGGLDFDGNNSTTAANKNGNGNSLQFGDPNIVDARKPLSGLTKSMDDAIGGAYKNAPPGVSERVNKGFQAVMIKDWKVAKACFQAALLLDPDNEGLQKFIALCDYTPGNKEQINSLNTQKTVVVPNVLTPSQAEIDKFFINFNAGTYQNPPDYVRNYIRSMSSEDFKKVLEKLSPQKVANVTAPSQTEIDEFFIKFNAGTYQNPPDYVRNYIRSMSGEDFKKLLEKHSSQKLPVPAGATYVPTSVEVIAYLENARAVESPFFLSIPNPPSTFSQKFRIYINSLNPEEYKRFLYVQLPQEEDMELLFDVTIPPVKSKTNTPGQYQK